MENKHFYLSCFLLSSSNHPDILHDARSQSSFCILNFVFFCIRFHWIGVSVRGLMIWSIPWEFVIGFVYVIRMMAIWNKNLSTIIYGIVTNFWIFRVEFFPFGFLFVCVCVPFNLQHPSLLQPWWTIYLRYECNWKAWKLHADFLVLVLVVMLLPATSCNCY